MAKREKTKHKGIYKVGDIYYITYYVGSKKYEKAVGFKLSDAVKEKSEREDKVRSGKYAAMEKQERTTFKELFELYKKGRGWKEVCSPVHSLIPETLRGL